MPGTLIGPDITTCVPTITDNAVAQGLISEPVVGISFRPTTTESNTNGELTFGGVNPGRFTPGELRFVSVHLLTLPSSPNGLVHTCLR